MPPKLLLVCSPQQRSRLLEVLEGKTFEIDCAAGFLDAKEKLGGSARYALLVVDAELSDGSWQDLLQLARRSGRTAAAIVCARLGDHRLWAEVLESGAYDLITEPYQQQEVARIVEAALNSTFAPQPAAALTKSPS